MATAFALVWNLCSQDTQLPFKNFRLWKISQGDVEKITKVREMFPKACYGDWIYERRFSDGVSRIGYDIEDDLFLLRLFEAGDLTFAGVVIHDNGRTSRLMPYRVISELVSSSTYPYKLNQNKCNQWDAFAREMMSLPAWYSKWFGVARRFFLYGGGKEFNPEIDEVDRVVDYMIALEAALVPERDFVGKRLRKRAEAILPPNGNEDVPKLIQNLYDIRSTIAHGSALCAEQKTYLNQEHKRFETLVRQVLIETLKRFSRDEQERRCQLVNLDDISDDDREETLVQVFHLIKNAEKRKHALEMLGKVKPKRSSGNTKSGVKE